MIDLIREISQTLGHNKLRTALTGISVTWGIFMLIVLLGMARGLTNNFDEMLANRNTASIRVYGGYTTYAYHGKPEGRTINPKTRDLGIIKAADPQRVEKIKPNISGGGKISSPKTQISQSFSGVYPSDKPTGNFGEMTQGRFISQRDVDEGARVIVLPQRYAKELFPPEGKEALGNRVTYNGLSFLVIGIYESRWNREVFIPFTTAQRLAADKQTLGMLTVDLAGLNSEEDADEAESTMRNALARSHDFDPNDRNAIFLANSFKNALQVQTVRGIITTGVWVLGLLTLLTGIVGVSNIMFVTVRERTHEIGIRRAIGAKPRKILVQFISESVAITLVFGYIGIVLGTFVTQVIASFMGSDGPLTNPTVSLTIALEVTITLVITGIIAGLFPALKAIKVKPVEALHDE